MSASTPAVWSELRELLEHAISNHPRSQQAALGPSELGNACDRCLCLLLAGQKGRELVTPWLPTIGTAVHAWLEGAVSSHGQGRYLTEQRVLVGHLAGVPIHGSCDLFDTQTGTVIDWKVVGKSTRDKARRHGASLTYQRQTQLYAYGLSMVGQDVRNVAIIYLPRDAVSLAQTVLWQAPYAPQVALDTLERANRFLAWINAYGLQAVLEATPAHTGDEFSCNRLTDNSRAGGIPATVQSIING